MRRRWVFWIAVIVAGVLLDQWSKRWALEALERGQTVLAWGGLLKLTLSFNQGAAFGLRLGAAGNRIARIDVTGKPIETSADEILKQVRRQLKRGNSDLEKR